MAILEDLVTPWKTLTFNEKISLAKQIRLSRITPKKPTKTKPKAKPKKAPKKLTPKQILAQLSPAERAQIIEQLGGRR